MTMYAVRPDPKTGEIGEEPEVVDQLKPGWQFIEQASTLWQLVDKQRAAELDAFMIRMNDEADIHDQPRMYEADLREAIRLLEGVEDAIIAAGIVDHHWRVAPERLEDLARTVPAMDLTTNRSIQSKTSALGEVMINAFSIRNFLKNALAEKCIVILG